MRQKTQLELAISPERKGEAPRQEVGGTEACAANAALESQAVVLGPSMEAIVERDNLKKALAQVKRNKGAPGVDAMRFDELASYLKSHWPAIRAQFPSFYRKGWYPSQAVLLCHPVQSCLC